MFERGQRLKYKFVYPPQSGQEPEEVLCIVMDTRTRPGEPQQLVDLFDFKELGSRENVKASECELDCFQEMVDVNPSRYPKHENAVKGQVYGGICNITRCEEIGATWWNLGTFGLYCQRCAMGINQHSYATRKPPICVEVEAKPKVTEHEELRVKHKYWDAF